MNAWKAPRCGSAHGASQESPIRSSESSSLSLSSTDLASGFCCRLSDRCERGRGRGTRGPGRRGGLSPALPLRTPADNKRHAPANHKTRRGVTLAGTMSIYGQYSGTHLTSL